MSNDLVKRLRDDYQKTVPLCAEAADRIEQLEADLAAERKLKTIYFDEWQAASARERELRELLVTVWARIWKPEELHARIDAVLGGGDE